MRILVSNKFELVVKCYINFSFFSFPKDSADSDQSGAEENSDISDDGMWYPFFL